MAKEKLHEEQEHMEMAKMENDIKWLNEKRLVMVKFKSDQTIDECRGWVPGVRQHAKQTIDKQWVPELHNSVVPPNPLTGLKHDKHEKAKKPEQNDVKSKEKAAKRKHESKKHMLPKPMSEQEKIDLWLKNSIHMDNQESSSQDSDNN